MDLCKSGNFDDYVLYWPQSQDGHRLSMSIWNAAKSLASFVNRPSRHEITSHAHQVGEVEAMLRRDLAEGEAKFGEAARAMQVAEQAVGAALDEFSRGLADSNRTGPQDGAALVRQVARLKTDGVSSAFRVGAEKLAPIAAWPRQLKERLEPHLDGIRAFANAVNEVPTTLLIVDDDPLIRKLITMTLADQAYGLEFAESGAAALQLLRRSRPALILMDIGLPDVDGITLTRKLKAAAHLADIPVLMLTGDSNRETIANSVVAGAAGFIVKPFTREALLQQISRALRSPVLVASGTK